MGGGKVKMGLPLVACLALQLLVQLSSAATSHVVGDSTGWTIPPSASFYSSWASKQTFLVGDFLVFNFANGAHTVAEVKKSDYDSCTTSSPITQVNNGPANLTISSASTHYYICTIAGHCSAGQKLAITASSPAAPTPKSTPSPTTAPSPKSAATPAASPAPKSSPSAPTPSPATAPPPSSGAPTPAPSAPSPTAASAPGPSAAGPPESSAPGPSPFVSPETAPSPSAGSGPSSPPPMVPGGPPAPPGSPTGAPASTPPGSDSPAAGAGLVLPLLAIIGAQFLY